MVARDAWKGTFMIVSVVIRIYASAMAKVSPEDVCVCWFVGKWAETTLGKS